MNELNQIFSENIVNRFSKGEEYIKIGGNISFSPQKPFLLTKTVKDNIVFYNKEDPEKLKKAVNMAFLADDIANFDNGLDKLLIENGMNLSGGQRSRINLARCFYKDADIILLDSPFAALDFDTSRKILEESIVRDLADKTRIIVTHNIQFLKYADKIILLKRGKVAFTGNFPQFSETDFYKNYRASIRFKVTSDKFVTNIEFNMRKRSKSKGFLDIVDRKLSATKVSHALVVISKEEKDYFKGFLEEDRVEGRQLKNMFGLVFTYYGGLFLLVLIFCFCVAINYMFYLSSLYLYDLIEQNRTSGAKFWEDIKLYIVLNVLPGIISFVRVVAMAALSVKTSKTLHQRMLFETLHADLCLFHDKIEPGRIINRFSSDLDSVDNFYISGYIDVCILLFSFLTFEIYVTKEATSIYLVILFVLYFIAIFYFQSLYIKARKDLFRLERIGGTPIINLTNQIIEGSVVIKIFKKQDEIIDELAQLINQNTKNVLTMASLNGWFNTRLAFVNIFCIQFLAFVYILIFNDKNSLNAKQLEIFISLIFVMIFDSKEFMQNFCQLETEIINLERCDALLRLPTEKRYLNLAAERKLLSHPEKLKPSFLLPLKIYSNDDTKKYEYNEINNFNFNKAFFLKGHISFQAVFAKYPLTLDYVLRNVSFEITPGQKLGIIGKSGSGKSTILKLLLQYFTPEKGKIIVDGYDICKIDAKKLRSEFLVISQEITMFEGTLRDNLIFENFIHKKEGETPNSKNVSKTPKQRSNENNLHEPLLNIKETKSEDITELEMPLEMEQEIISKLIEFGFSKRKLTKHGLDLPITNSGDNLSIGEQQLIAFFKAFFTKKKIICLDEATSAFDYVTQQKLMDYFNLKIKGKTVISVAHKITTIADFDKLLVLDNGFVVEYGYIKELMQNEHSHFKVLVDQYLKF